MSKNRRSGFRAYANWLLLAATAVVVGTALGQTVTTTTYSYNADGAPTRILEQVDDHPATVTYLTWDNFVPDADDPTTGTVLVGNGNLVAQGPAPGIEAATRHFEFDSRDGLIGYEDADASVGYRFHPSWLMASLTLASGDTRYFYYDHGTTAQMTNIEDSGSGLLSAELGALRSLSDGGFQVLLSPRKDVAGVYDPELGSFAPYRYDPFGDAEASGAAADAYDLQSNPRRYAGEYKDPTWGGYYLRARWYAPSLQTFIGRDPVANLNRYGYTDGNPVTRVDPDGRSHKPWRLGGLEKFLNKTLGLGKNNAGGAFARIFLGPVLSPFQLLADPGGFYHQQVHSKGGFKGWVTLGVVGLEAFTDYLPGAGYANYGVRLLVDLGVGSETSLVNALSHGGKSFSWRAFAQGMEYRGRRDVLCARGRRTWLSAVQQGS